MGVAGLDMPLSVVQDLLKIDPPHIGTYIDNSFLVNADGDVIVPEGEAIPGELVDQIKNGKSGLIRTEGKCVVFLPLDVMDWYYVVVADSADLEKEALSNQSGQESQQRGK